MLDRNASKMLSEVGIGEGQSVLDFGCGSGTYSIPAAKLVGKNGRIYSLDVSQGALEKLSRQAPKKTLLSESRLLINEPTWGKQKKP
jgi:ubiquinone/menaquinone biosynthesis C-methylase UbiE